MDSPLIDEIALRCGDITFKDFNRKIYERTWLRSTRKVARRYHLIERVFEFDSLIKVPSGLSVELINEYIEDKVTKDIALALPSFKAETKVVINNYEYTKRNEVEASDYQYVIYRNENQTYFNYSPRSEEDKVIIHYISDINEDDYDVEEIMPVIPSQYNEELISLACVEVAKLGVVKYNETKEGGKYTNILRLYALDERQLENNLIRNDQWIEMKVWRAI